MPHIVSLNDTDPYEYGLSLFTVKFKSLNNESIGVPCEDVPEISNATRESAHLNRGFDGDGDKGIHTTYWFSICPPYGSLEYNGYYGSSMEVKKNTTYMGTFVPFFVLKYVSRKFDMNQAINENTVLKNPYSF